MENEYKTRDIGEATALLTLKRKFLRLDNDGDFFWFVFKDKKTSLIADRYWSGALKVGAKDYNNCFKDLKDRIFARQNERIVNE